MVTGNKIKTKNHFKLILYLDYTHLKCALFNLETNCFETIKVYKLEYKENQLETGINKIIEKEEYLNQNYHTVLCAIDLSVSTFVPESLFDNQLAEKYFNKTFHYIQIIQNLIPI